MSYRLLNSERHGHVGVITLNRSDKLNALNAEIRSELIAALEELGGEFPHVRAVVLTGAGRGFCSGADVQEQAEGLSQEAERRLQTGNAQPTTDPGRRSPAPLIREIPQPVIAAINGVAAGMGLSIRWVWSTRWFLQTS